MTNFDELPTEILELIVRAILEHPPDSAEHEGYTRHDTICGLKSLRSVSRVVAALPSVYVALFSTIPVYGIPQHVTHVGQLDTIQRILPHVRGVSFKAYPFASAITLDEYADIAPLERYESLEQDFEYFLGFARSAEECLRDPKTSDTWQHLLTRLPNLQHVNIDTTLDHILIKDSDIWRYFSPQAPVFKHGLRRDQTYVIKLGPKTAILCQSLAKVVMQCIADTQLPSLRVGGIFHIDSDWNSMPGMGRVDWARLKALEVGSHFVVPRNHPDGNSVAISTLFAQVNDSLEELTVSLASSPKKLHWPPLAIRDLALLRLHRLEIKDMPLHGHNFVEFIQKQAALSHLVLDNVRSDAPWQLIFDGLRAHPNTLTITFSNMHMSFLCRQSVRTFTTRPGYAPGMFDDNDPKHNLDDSGINPTIIDKLENIVLYIQSYIPWTRDLEDDLGILRNI